MPDAEIAGPGGLPVAGEAAGGGVAGVFGKIPSRGDFLRLGLPRDFVQGWDDWLQQVVGGSRARLGERWLPAWMEAPIWHFALPAGLCGAAPVVGAWMPSVDRAGRHFPLTLAMVFPSGLPQDLGPVEAWLARAEAAGLAALGEELEPAALQERLGAEATAVPPEPSAALPDLAPLADGQAIWWTEGSPFVPPGLRAFPALPDVDAFMTMLDATSATGPATEATGTSDATEGM